ARAPPPRRDRRRVRALAGAQPRAVGAPLPRRMTRPKVLFLTTSFPTAEAPADGVFVLEHARAAAAHAEVAVLHLDRRHGARGISVRRDDGGGEFPVWRAAYPYRPTALSAMAHVAAGFAGFRAVRRSGFDPDLLHAHFF